MALKNRNHYESECDATQMRIKKEYAIRAIKSIQNSFSVRHIAELDDRNIFTSSG